MRMPVVISAVLVLAIHVGAAQAQDPMLERTEAFDRAFAASFYIYDACGDAKHGRIFRQALVERFRQCPFTPAAQASFRQRSAAQKEKSAKIIEAIIEEHGGLPVRLDGMTLTCHEQQRLPDYVALSEKLDLFGDGRLAVADLMTAPCDAETIAP